MAAASSLSDVSPDTPTAPRTAPVSSRIKTPPATGTMPRPATPEIPDTRCGRSLCKSFEAARTHADGERAERLAGRHLRPEQRGAVLALEGNEVAAGVEHRDAERLQLQF